MGEWTFRVRADEVAGQLDTFLNVDDSGNLEVGRQFDRTNVVL
jgi:hypothetical protein